MQTTAHNGETKLMFLSGMFDETMRLLSDAQDYFSAVGPQTETLESPVEKMVYSSEMSRITLRLSSVMAWLLARRAEYAGQISPEEAAERFRLAFADVCLKDLPEMHVVLPEGMCALLERSLELYRRAARLDSQIGEKPATMH